MRLTLQTSLFALFFLCTSITFSQNYTVKDSITVFTDSVFSILENKNLYRDKIDWSTYKKEFQNKVSAHKTLKDALLQYRKLFVDLGDKHTSIQLGDFDVRNPYAGVYTGEEFSPGLMARYQQGNFEFECKVLDNQYGYLFIPGNSLPSGENLEAIAQPMYDAIANLAENNTIKGWIIDLRFNTGGNMWPMVAGLYELLGEGHFGGWNIENRIQKCYLKDGKAFETDKVIVEIDRTSKLDLSKEKVAIITGVLTGSSGEVVAIAFKGRENTIFIGEPSAGYTTTNNTYRMPFGGFFNNAEGYDVDRNGVEYDKIIPDIPVVKSDNFKNLMEDKNILEAIKNIKSL
ncbi:S41 family peptidase [Aquimarina mytili]|uniref:S41 family peptidase n=1 Tax=Aquimarina mytili TaxID=874423 RepID=A0A936ZZ45_9FLAO|nr:S41 family peptidase [Aquimarina mytili]MBL0682100.1 S41 family peptidase [Aquimarina mytili]